jgi:hypothetical protein
MLFPVQGPIRAEWEGGSYEKVSRIALSAASSKGKRLLPGIFYAAKVQGKITS